MENAEALNGINMIPFEQAAVAGLELTLGLLLFIMSFILLIVCAKVANPKSAHSSGATTEIAAVTALGSASKRILVQLLVESSLLALVGAGVGAYFAWDGIRIALAVFPAEILRFESIGIKSYLLLFAFTVPLLAVFPFGLPRLRKIRRLLSRTAMQSSPKSVPASASSPRPAKRVLVGA